MQTPGQEPSMEDILASIKKVIAEEKEQRTMPPLTAMEAPQELAEPELDDDEDVLELNEPLAPSIDLGPPLLDQSAAESSRQSLETLSTIAATVPHQPQVNPLEEMVRVMLRPILKQWLDDHLPGIVDEHVKREISRITGRSL
jgi:cell pole-organizing protein PopZ